MKTLYTHLLLRLGLLFVFFGAFSVFAQEQPKPLVPSSSEIQFSPPNTDFSDFTVSQLKAIKAKASTYQFVMTQTRPGLKQGIDVELEIAIPGKLEINAQNKLVQTAVTVKNKGKADEYFPSEFTLFFSSKGVTANVADDKSGFVEPLFEALFFDLLNAKEYPDAGFRDFKAGDMMPVLSMSGFHSQIGPLKFVKADGGLVEFEALPDWVGRIPRLPNILDLVYPMNRLTRPFVGKVIFSKDTFLIQHLEVKTSPPKPGGNEEDSVITLKLVKK